MQLSASLTPCPLRIIIHFIIWCRYKKYIVCGDKRYKVMEFICRYTPYRFKKFLLKAHVVGDIYCNTIIIITILVGVYKLLHYGRKVKRKTVVCTLYYYNHCARRVTGAKIHMYTTHCSNKTVVVYIRVKRVGTPYWTIGYTYHTIYLYSIECVCYINIRHTNKY